MKTVRVRLHWTKTEIFFDLLLLNLFNASFYSKLNIFIKFYESLSGSDVAFPLALTQCMQTLM